MSTIEGRPVELMALFWTIAGVVPGEGEMSRFAFPRRVEAAARAGFTGIGLWHTDLEHVMLHHSLAEMKHILDDNGMRHLELEFLTDWFADGGRRRESDGRRRRLLEASAALDASHVKIGDFYRSRCPMSRLVDEFAKLCEEAAGFGATIGFEIMDSAMIDNLADALMLVERADAPNGGIIIDIVQAVNLPIPYDQISRIPRRRLVCVELNDGLFPGNALSDLAARRFCGDGEFDIRGFIASVRTTGYDGPWAVEVFNRELAQLPVEHLAGRAYETTMSQFRDDA